MPRTKKPRQWSRGQQQQRRGQKTTMPWSTTIMPWPKTTIHRRKNLQPLLYYILLCTRTHMRKDDNGIFFNWEHDTFTLCFWCLVTRVLTTPLQALVFWSLAFTNLYSWLWSLSRMFTKWRPKIAFGHQIFSKTYIMHSIVVVGHIKYGLWLVVLGIHHKCIP